MTDEREIKTLRVVAYFCSYTCPGTHPHPTLGTASPSASGVISELSATRAELREAVEALEAIASIAEDEHAESRSLDELHGQLLQINNRARAVVERFRKEQGNTRL